MHPGLGSMEVSSWEGQNFQTVLLIVADEGEAEDMKVRNLLFEGVFSLSLSLSLSLSVSVVSM